MGTIGILADQGKPQREVKGVLSKLLEDFRDSENDDDIDVMVGEYPGIGRVEFRAETVPMSPDGDVMLSEYAGKILEIRGWDRMIYVTDLPLTAWERPVISQRAAHDDAVLISLPALGVVAATRALRRELVSLIEHGVPVAGVAGHGPDEEGEESDDSAEVLTRVLDHRGRTLRMIAGMVRCNEPSRLLSVLSSSLAAMAATGGFGIFYGSIWNMADALSIPRLLMISLLAVGAFGTWLIIHNRLWQRMGTQESRWRESIDNLATLGTIGMTVLLIYALALGVMLVASVAVIPGTYLEDQLGHEVGWFTYVAIAWLSASLGTMAGALGSNFDRDVEIRSATYNLREYQRRMQAGHYNDEDDQ
ncbi:hypothetical protein [Corynebacterium halotolerans]|uniref:DUF2267 domain-containing protein n=1 Tax=Corynebacterium halotolerans YIM 70093 = DSM 44683 TaxID=1121362 RepID=M1NPE8_9CORY|nr:hypothetical protein [Corynebacterium halotolerans]AGF71392.1 hypothetical protein A605_01890 [Corynebacterium halotolerans YIM 70093 = DSM 44683]